MDDGGDTLQQHLRSIPPADPYTEEPRCAEAVVGGEIPEQADSPTQAAPASMPGDRSPPVTMGGYQLGEMLGGGGVGVVYKALHVKLGKTVAVKILRPGRIADAATSARFESEMKAVGRLSHRHIVQATDAGEDDSTPFLVMEYVEGTTLSKLVQRQGPLPIAKACEYVGKRPWACSTSTNMTWCIVTSSPRT